MKFNITGDDDVQQAASTFVKAMEELHLKRRIDVWEMLAGFSITQLFSWLIHYHQLPCHMKYSLNDQAKTSQVNSEYLVDV